MTERRLYPKVLAETGDGEMLHVVGREAETLLGLVEKGERGLRAYDFAGGPPFRLAAYVHDLRGMGLAIRTEREAHATGQHGVYMLETPVRIVETMHPDAEDEGEAA
jgi:hypothetical protein